MNVPRGKNLTLRYKSVHILSTTEISQICRSRMPKFRHFLHFIYPRRVFSCDRHSIGGLKSNVDAIPSMPFWVAVGLSSSITLS